MTALQSAFANMLPMTILAERYSALEEVVHSVTHGIGALFAH